MFLARVSRRIAVTRNVNGQKKIRQLQMCWKSAPLAIYHQILGQNGLTFFLGQKNG
jgi:hypothetical protein